MAHAQTAAGDPGMGIATSVKCVSWPTNENNERGPKMWAQTNGHKHTHQPQKQGGGGCLVPIIAVAALVLLLGSMSGADQRTVATIAGVALAGVTTVAALIVGAMAVGLDSPRKAEADRPWWLTTLGALSWLWLTGLACMVAPPLGLIAGVLWAALVARRRQAVKHKPVRLVEAMAACGRALWRWKWVAGVAVLVVAAAWVAALNMWPEAYPWAAAAAGVTAVALRVAIRRDVARTGELRALHDVLATKVLGIDQTRAKHTAIRVRGGEHPRIEITYVGVGAPVRTVGDAEAVAREVDARLTAYVPELEGAGVTDRGAVFERASLETEDTRELRAQTRGLVERVTHINENLPNPTKES